MSETLFEKLKKISKEKPGKLMDSKTAEKYRKEIESCTEDEELVPCFNHSEIHPIFWQFILERFLQTEEK